MKKNIIFLLFFLCPALYSQNSNDFNKEIDFYGKGLSPDWNLSVKMNNEIRFSINNTEKVFNTSSVKEYYKGKKPPVVFYIGGSTRTEPDGWIFTAKNKKSKITIKATNNPDSKNASDSTYYTVKIIIKDNKKKKTKTYNGFGNYTADKRLENIWYTKKIFGEDFKHSGYSKDSSFVSFNIKKHSAFGIAGCNHFSFKIDVRGSVISFYMATLTMILCDNQKEEDKFIGALSGNDFRYRFEDNKIILINESNKTIEFEKRR